MKKSTLFYLLVAVVGHCVGVVAAASLPLETLPANARWLLQLDVKALRAAPLGKELLADLAGTPTEAELQAFETTFACDVRRDLDAVTACGDGGAEQGNVVYLRGNWNLRKVSTVLAGNPSLASAACGRHTILSWSDTKASKRAERQCVCLLSSNLVLLANREAALRQALDALDGRTPTLATVPRFRRMAAALDTNAFLRVIAVGVKEILADQPLAVALPADACLRLALHADGQEARLKAVIQVDTPGAALQMQQALVGIQAVMMLQGLKNPDIGKISQSARIDVTGEDVSVVLSAPFETLKRLLIRQKSSLASHPHRQAQDE
jgi:hypothetical protein